MLIQKKCFRIRTHHVAFVLKTRRLLNYIVDIHSIPSVLESGSRRDILVPAAEEITSRESRSFVSSVDGDTTYVLDPSPACSEKNCQQVVNIALRKAKHKFVKMAAKCKYILNKMKI